MSYSRVGKVENIVVYPIKSCKGQSIGSWPISKRGLLYDREFGIFSEERRGCLSLRNDTRMRHIQPYIDLDKMTMRLECIDGESRFDNGKEREAITDGDREFRPIEISIDDDATLKLKSESDSFTGTVCSDKVAFIDCGKEAREFVERVFGEEGYSLVRNAFSRRFSCGKKETARLIDAGYATAESEAERNELDRIRELISVAEHSKVALPDEAQYLLATRTTLKHMCTGLKLALGDDRFDQRRMIERMRVNITIDDTLTSSFGEERWRHVRIGGSGESISSTTLEVDVTGACKRCPAVAVELDSGVIDAEPLNTLNKLRNKYQYFGVHANNSEAQREELKRVKRGGNKASIVNVGDTVYACEQW